MSDALFWPLLALYGLVLMSLFTYGLNFFYLVRVAFRNPDHGAAPPPLDEHPFVTVQLPIFNEQYVARRLIDAVCRLDWPRDRLEVQVLDDSTDSTQLIAAEAVQQWRARGLDIVHIHREERSGFKAGALADGLERARGEFIAVFDADFVPRPDFLVRMVPLFADPEVGFVQARWDHLNADYSFLTRLQSLAIDAHFAIEQYARQRGGFFLNFNGTAGLWRAQAIHDAGGWSADTLTEDLDLSYRAQLRGWRPEYRRDVVAPAELPVTINACRRQQYRWARGSFECALKLLPAVLRAPMPRRRRFEAVLHLTGYGIHFLMAVLALLYPLVATVSRIRPELVALFGLAAALNLTALAPTVYFLSAQRALGRPWRAALPAVLALSVLGAGMMVNSVVAILAAFRRRAAAFERTPKFGIAGTGESWTGKAYRPRVSPVPLLEALFLLWNLNTVRLAMATGHYAIGFYAAVFALGLAYVLGLTVQEGVRHWRHDFLRRRLAGPSRPPGPTARLAAGTPPSGPTPDRPAPPGPGRTGRTG